MRIAVIVNPISGRDGRDPEVGRRRVALARELVAAGGADAEVVATTGLGHARELARDFSGRRYDRVIVWGGDGTVNEVAGPLRRSATMLGIVPAGSGDGIARSLGLPSRSAHAMEAALSQVSRPVDVGLLGDRHFLNIGGIGFDAAVAVAFNARQRRGVPAYIEESLKAVWSYRCEEYALSYNGEQVAGPHFLIAFANGREYGNGLVLAPDADAADGWLNLVLVAGGSPVTQVWRARRLVVRRLAAARGIRRDRVQNATVSGRMLRCHVDGETFEANGTIPVALEPGSLRVAGFGLTD